MPAVSHALSVQQPWARALLAPGPNRKPLENRGHKQADRRPPFPVPPGSWLGIHAGTTIHQMADWCLSLCPEVAPAPLWERGVVLGAVRVIGWERAAVCRARPELARWVVSADHYVAQGQPDGWCLLVEDPIRLAQPVPVRGWLGRFELPIPIEIG